MPLLKKFLLASLCYGLVAIVKLLQGSYRYRYFNKEHRSSAEGIHKNRVMIMAIWHNNCFAGILSHTYQNFAPLMSQSRDGDLVAFVCERFGIKTVRGSSSRGGRAARDVILANFSQGFSSAITVDGPKGPAHEVKFGIIDLAKTGQVAILPFCSVADRYWQLRSWDKFRIPKPFSRIAVCYDRPILVPAATSKEEYPAFAEQLQKSLVALELRATENLAQWVKTGPHVLA